MKRYLLIATISLLGFSCTKFLDEKPDKKLAVPSTLKDLQAILDNHTRLNQLGPGLDDPSADDYFLSTTTYNGMAETERRLYTWEKDFVNGKFPNDWSYSWDNVFRANTVLDVLPSIDRNDFNAAQWDNIKGQALAIRGFSFQILAYTYCLAYDPPTADNDLGLPLRLDPDFNVPSVRKSVAETYQQIINDFQAAAPLLPVTPLATTRMSKPAVFGLLSRTYLSMRQYDKAGVYADSSLKLYSTLNDYNTFSTTASFPFPKFNPEVIWEHTARLHEQLYQSNARIDTFLYKQYADNDLRKTMFFKPETGGYYSFKGSYEGGEGIFAGIATDEVYLMRGEANARNGNKDAALNDLNALMVKRWKKTAFIPFTAADAPAALKLIVAERRKELLFRKLRWMDIKRYNKEGASIGLKRTINNTTYSLPPNDLRYAISIPEDVITLSGMPQNPR